MLDLEIVKKELQEILGETDPEKIKPVIGCCTCSYTRERLYQLLLYLDRDRDIDTQEDLPTIGSKKRMKCSCGVDEG